MEISTSVVQQNVIKTFRFHTDCSLPVRFKYSLKCSENSLRNDNEWADDLSYTRSSVWYAFICTLLYVMLVLQSRSELRYQALSVCTYRYASEGPNKHKMQVQCLVDTRKFSININENLLLYFQFGDIFLIVILRLPFIDRVLGAQ